MREIRGQRVPPEGRVDARGGEAEISMLRQQIVALADADYVLPEDGGALLAALDAAHRDLAAGNLPAAWAGMERFIAGAQDLMEAGVLARPAGHPPLEAARALLTALRDG
jgi:hypothetical protein